MQYVWLIFLAPFVSLLLMKRPGAAEMTLSLALLFVFLWSYIQAYAGPPRVRGWHVLLQAAIGLILLPWNPGAFVFFVYAGAVAGLLQPDAAAWRGIALVAVAGAGWVVFVDGRATTALAIGVLTPLIGLSTLAQAREQRAVIALKEATARNLRLAAIAERERIARDLHDALGHTLSLVVLKAQVARRLAGRERDPEESASGTEEPESRGRTPLERELAELEDAARGALVEVRRAVRGYRAPLDDAVRTARSLLGAAGVHSTFALALAEPDADRDALLAAVLRELTTNVARHAAAATCRITADETDDGTRLTVADDGRGGASLAGQGLRGVAERVESVGGRVLINGQEPSAAPRTPASSRGTSVVVWIPKPVSASLDRDAATNGSLPGSAALAAAPDSSAARPSWDGP